MNFLNKIINIKHKPLEYIVNVNLKTIDVLNDMYQSKRFRIAYIKLMFYHKILTKHINIKIEEID